MSTPSVQRLARLAVRWYPHTWRDRYAEEVLDVLDQHHITPGYRGGPHGERRRHPPGPGIFRISPDGRAVVTADHPEHDTITVWNIADSQKPST
jgi:hypothetical protein